MTSMSKGVSRTAISILMAFGGITGMSFGRYLGPVETLVAVVAGAALFGVAGWALGGRLAKVQTALSQSEG